MSDGGSFTPSRAVLGTAIERLAACDGPTLLISDLHIPQDGGAALAHLQWALSAARQQQARMFLLGDLFDSYVSPAQIKVGAWQQTCVALRAAVDAGVAIDVLVGNRDFLLGPEFEARSGARLHHGGVRLRLGGTETLLLHGDELCLDDLPYQRAKRWLRSGPIRLVARHLPLRWALRAAARARRKSAAVIQSGDQSRFLPTRAALEVALRDGVERVVFGHIHRLATAAIGSGEVFVLPAFDAAAVGFRATAAGFEPVGIDSGGATTWQQRLPALALSAAAAAGAPSRA